ncbi:mediator of RNA polymerase II transcription subunit 27 isoform X2 [Phasianus colchicus]|uniref:mediator of RNA polymerase II transcription subunit 27 isoform X2 n=1 Tax=Phasianus colchicus TaxID=9054 RepID=UPI00129E16C8|nr:mediator of RNA polymerase II transcription subunit 27 isoform X2 [Phasianus colchicus]
MRSPTFTPFAPVTAHQRFLSCLFRPGDTKRLRKRPQPTRGKEDFPECPAPPLPDYISQRAPRCRAAAGRRREGAGRAKMADGVLSPGVNLEAFSQAIAAIQALRSSVTRVFDCLKDGMRNKETLEGREKGFVAAFQESLHSVSRDLGELERLSNLVGKPSENHPLHNSGLLSLDPVQDKTPLYSQLLQAYKWSNKLQYHAGLASGLLNQQSLKRSANQMGVSAKRRPKAQPTTLVLPPQYVDDVINRIDRMFPEMSIQLSRPNGTSAMLLVTLGKVLKVIVVMRSLFIDRTIVKGYNENVYTDDGKIYGFKHHFAAEAVVPHSQYISIQMQTKASAPLRPEFCWEVKE